MTVSPDKTITLAGREYLLSGSFRALKGIQTAFDRDILEIGAECLRMRSDELAKLIRIAVGEGAPSEVSIEEAVMTEIGVLETRFLVAEWLNIALAPPEKREKKAELMGKLRGQLTA